MSLIDTVLRLTLFAYPLVVAILALLRLRRSRSLNRPIYGAIGLIALAISAYSGPKILFATDVPAGAILAALSTAPLWLATIGACALTRKSRYYARRTTDDPWDGVHSPLLSSETLVPASGSAPQGLTYSRNFARPPQSDDAPSLAQPRFRSCRLQTLAGGATPAE